MGLLDFAQNNSDELLAFGSGLLSAPGGRGLAAGAAQLQNLKQRQLENEATRQIMAMRSQQMKKGDFELQQLQNNVDRQNRIRNRLMGIGTEATAQVPSGGYMAGPQQDSPNWMQDLKQNQQAGAQMAPKGTGSATQSFIDRLSKQAEIYTQEGDYEGANKLMEHAAKFMPEVSKIDVVTDAQGNPIRVITMKDGTERVSQFGAPRDMTEVGLGNRKTFVDKNRVGNGQSFDVGVSPDTVYSGNVSMRGQNLLDSRARELNAITREGQQTQVINDPMRGPMLVNKGTGVARQAVDANGVQIQGEVPAKREANSRNILPLLDQANALIDQSTGSYAGFAADKAAQVFGKATEGAKGTAQLKVLEAQLMMAQPRMEGPQSDKDVAMYRQAAAQLGDPTVPREIKKAALGVVKQIHEKYAGANQPTQPQKKSAIKGQVEDGYRFKGGNPADPNSWEKL